MKTLSIFDFRLPICIPLLDNIPPINNRQWQSAIDNRQWQSKIENRKSAMS